MRISRIYTDQSLAPGSIAELSSAASHHVAVVLRLRAGSPLVLFNGDGNEYRGHIETADKKRVLVSIEEQSSPVTESRLFIHLGLGISRGEKMDYAIQKSTELGVNSITPLFTDHSEVKLKGERLERKVKHWQQVAVSACEQSGRVRIPPVHVPVTLEEWTGSVGHCLKLIFDGQQNQLSVPASVPVEAAVLIGPEGGFSENEKNIAGANGFQGARLGNRVLRTETAPVAVLAVLQYLWGDFRNGESGGF